LLACELLRIILCYYNIVALQIVKKPKKEELKEHLKESNEETNGGT
jgi:hypothetical protein